MRDDTLPALARYSETIPSRKNTHRIGLGTYTLAATYLATPHNEWIQFTNKLWRENGYTPADDKSIEFWWTEGVLLFENSLL
jgi:hypothetical protein